MVILRESGKMPNSNEQLTMSSTSTTRLSNTSLKKEVGMASREQVDEFILRIILRNSALLILEKDVRES